ncbi:MAG: FMN-binding protein [Eubacteriales bacterium]|nr:FMN-binding protein [Eubacteriales bacterium]
MRKGKKRVWILIVLGALAVMAAIIYFAMAPGMREAMNLTMANIDFSNLKDGTWTGEYKGTKDSIRNCKVEATVQDGRVTAVRVLEGPLAKPGGETVKIRDTYTIGDLFGRVIQGQTLQVDVISGATITSKTHLKAVENALQSALKP